MKGLAVLSVFLLLPLIFFASLAFYFLADGEESPFSAQNQNLSTLSPEEAKQIAIDAYIYGYSLVTTEITKQAFTNTVRPDPERLQAPINQIVNEPHYPPATYKGVTAPNADTLYTASFLDLSAEPMVFSYPDMGNRYFLFPIYDAWTEVIGVPGTRTAGGMARNILITGPSWKGKVPENMQQIKSPTNLVFMIGRVYSDGTPKDIGEVHALQKQFKLVPLSSFGKAYSPPNGFFKKTESKIEVVRDVINAMTSNEYFNLMAQAMKLSPPVLPRDAEIVKRMAKIGLVPGRPFDINKLDPGLREELKDIGKIAYSQIMAAKEKTGRVDNGWVIPSSAGTYGADYLNRAAVSAFGWGANLPEDAVYPYALTGEDGKPLNGATGYKLHFDKGQMPPANGFWSITMYDSQFYFYPNALDKLNISPRNNLKYNDDGSLDLYFANKQPEGIPQSNWLPAPVSDFILMMRIYWPKETPPSILPTNDPSWLLPPLIPLSK